MIGLFLISWFLREKGFLYELPMLLPSRESGESLLHPTSYVVRIKFIPRDRFYIHTESSFRVSHMAVGGQIGTKFM